MTRAAVALVGIVLGGCLTPPTGSSDPTVAPTATSAPAVGSSPRYQPGRDIVYVADGETAADGLAAVAMPEGKVVERHDFAALSAYRQGSMAPNVAREFGFFTRTTVEGLRTYRTSLERIDLDSGERQSVDAGTVEFKGILAVGDHEAGDLSEAERDKALRSYSEQVARSYADAVTTPDASTVLLIRPRADSSTAVRVDRFDGRSLAHLGTRTWTVDPPDRLFAIDEDRVLSIRYVHPDLYSARQIWTLLDPDLRELATATGATPTDWPNYCSPDVRPLRDGRTWATICDRHERSYFLQLIDRERLTDAGRIELTDMPRYPGNVLDWHVAEDGTVIVLTDRPSLIRVDPVARRLIDHHVIASGSATPGVEGPVRTDASRRAQFSDDGRRLYLTYLGYDGRSWRSPLSLIDVASGRVIAEALSGPGVASVHLSADGARVYAIDDGRLVVLDPGTLRVISVTEPIVKPPGSILTVASRN